MVAGVAPDAHGRDVLHLAAMLARSAGDDIVLCAVVPAPWPVGPARVDAEYRAYLEQSARDALAQARERLPADAPVSTEIHVARSAPAGLLAVAERHGATLIVAGSTSAEGPGYVALGGVTSRLLRSAPVPVAMAPRGFRCGPDSRVTRVTAAFGGAEGAEDLVVAAAAVAAQIGASLRLASFAVRPRTPLAAGIGREADEAMIRQWVQEIEAAGRAALDRVDELPARPHELTAVIGHGETWDDALEDVEWDDGDVLVVGSSTIAPLARVFLGSRGSKIVRHSPVPVVVVPRGRQERSSTDILNPA